MPLTSSCLCLFFMAILPKPSITALPERGLWGDPNCTAGGVKLHVNLIILIGLLIMSMWVVLIILVSLIILIALIWHRRVCMCVDAVLLHERWLRLLCYCCSTAVQALLDEQLLLLASL